jgi:hypothetical protein
VHVAAASRADLHLRGDQLARHRVDQHLVARGGGAQLLEARDEGQAGGIEQRELLLDADAEVGRGLERLAGAVEVDQVR